MAQQVTQPDKGWETRYMIGFFGCLALVVGIVIAAFREVVIPFWIWIAIISLMISMTLFLSRAYTGNWMGILLDDRKKYSLSRLQMVMWTVIILSAFVTAVLANVQLKMLVYVSGAVKPAQVLTARVGNTVADALVAVGVIKPDATVIEGVDLSLLKLSEPLHDGEQIYVPLSDDPILTAGLPIAPENDSQPLTTPLSVEIPSAVWVLMGISTTSLVASPLIKGQKKKQIQTNDSTREARLSDLFKGEEDSNYTLLDLAKVQLFYFTIIVIGAYMIAVANLFVNTQNAITALPALDGGVIAMLGVSHAGYLTNKAIPRSEGDSSDGDAGGTTGNTDGDAAGQDTTNQSPTGGDDTAKG